MCQTSHRSFSTVGPPPDVRRQAAVEDLSLRLTHGDLPARIQAARDVRRLARASAKSRAALSAAGIVRPLLSLVAAPQGEAKEVAVLALLNVSAKNERNKVNIVKLGAVPPLVDLLKCESSSLRELATAAILTLSSLDCNKSIIISSGAPKFLTQILISGSIQGKVDAVTALYNLSTCTEVCEPCLYVESVFPLLALLKDNKKHSKFAEKATALLEKMAVSEEGRIAISEADDGILTLVETVEDGSLISIENAASILFTLIKNCREKYRKMILNEGAIPGLLLVTVYGTERAKRIAHDLLDLLRDDAKPNRVTPEVFETIVSDIASQIGGSENASETAGFLLKDMIRWNMEMRINQLTNASCSPTRPLT